MTWDCVDWRTYTTAVRLIQCSSAARAQTEIAGTQHPAPRPANQPVAAATDMRRAAVAIASRLRLNCRLGARPIQNMRAKEQWPTSNARWRLMAILLKGRVDIYTGNNRARHDSSAGA